MRIDVYTSFRTNAVSGAGFFCLRFLVFNPVTHCAEKISQVGESPSIVVMLP